MAMGELVLEAGWSEVWLRLAAFAGVFMLLVLAEHLLPRRTLTEPRTGRWFTNLAIVALDNVVVRAMAALSVPLAALAAAEYAQAIGIGVLNWLALPEWVEIAIAFVLLDLAIWAQHVASHKFPAFWNFHQVHHADRDIDVTTALRFHPVEIALSMLWKIAVVLALGAAPIAVLLFEIALNACAMFSHANLRLPMALDAALRTVVVTPDMHRVHHSTLRREHDSNYGFNFSIWDRIFGTYTPNPEKGQENMQIGLESYQNNSPGKLAWCLALPFKGRGK